MDQVVVFVVRAGELHHPAGKCGELGGQVVLLQPLVGPGHHVDNPVAGLHLHHLALAGAGGAGEHVHRGALAGQLGGGVVDVDVHAAGVAGPRLLERGGVH